MSGDISDESEASEAIPYLRWLKGLVTALAVVMMLGIASIVLLLWLRLAQAPLPELPGNIALPAGESPAAVTFARDWLVVVTDSGLVLLYDRNGTLQRRIAP